MRFIYFLLFIFFFSIVKAQTPVSVMDSCSWNLDSNYTLEGSRYFLVTPKFPVTSDTVLYFPDVTNEKITTVLHLFPSQNSKFVCGCYYNPTTYPDTFYYVFLNPLYTINSKPEISLISDTIIHCDTSDFFCIKISNLYKNYYFRKWISSSANHIQKGYLYVARKKKYDTYPKFYFKLICTMRLNQPYYWGQLLYQKDL